MGFVLGLGRRGYFYICIFQKHQLISVPTEVGQKFPPTSLETMWPTLCALNKLNKPPGCGSKGKTGVQQMAYFNLENLSPPADTVQKAVQYLLAWGTSNEHLATLASGV